MNKLHPESLEKNIEHSFNEREQREKPDSLIKVQKPKHKYIFPSK